MGAAPPDGVVLVQGAAGGLGLALVEALLARDQVLQLFAATRDPEDASLQGLADADSRLQLLRLDVEQPASVASAASQVARQTEHLDLIINCAGVLHDESVGMGPERRLAEVDAANLERAFRINAVGSLLVAQAFENLLRRGGTPLFASISARVGSIGDNRLGGWYAYRASKAALNMYLKTLAIEWGRGGSPVRVVALHPGTVATPLSAPFTRRANAPRVVFEPGQAARQLLAVLEGLESDATGLFLDWQGKSVPW